MARGGGCNVWELTLAIEPLHWCVTVGKNAIKAGDQNPCLVKSKEMMPELTFFFSLVPNTR